MRPLTLYHPKPMLQVLGKPILEHLLKSLPQAVHEVIVVVGYLGDQIRAYFGDQFGRLRIRYVVQDRPMGTYHALLLCKEFLDESRFLVMFADDLHGAGGLKRAVLQGDLTMLVHTVPDPTEFGVVEVGADGSIVGIEEKPEQPKTNLISPGIMVLDRRIFDYQPPQHRNGEYYLATAVNLMLRDHRVMAIEATAWQKVGYPEDLELAADFLKANRHLL